MSDANLPAAPVPDHDFEAYHKQVTSWLAEKRALYVRLNRLAISLAAGEMVVILILAAALMTVALQQKFIPIIIALNSDGSHDVLTHRDELPAQEQKNVVQSTLWAYVFNREEYIFEGAPTSYQIVSDLSDANVQKEYQQWFRSPQAPQARLGPNGYVIIQPVVDGVHFTSDHTAKISFWRYEQRAGLPPEKSQHYTASVSFVLSDAVAASVVDNNPLGISITSYHADCDSCGTS
jgi:type IV secretion system protein VirB8